MLASKVENARQSSFRRKPESRNFKVLQKTLDTGFHRYDDF